MALFKIACRTFSALGFSPRCNCKLINKAEIPVTIGAAQLVPFSLIGSSVPGVAPKIFSPLAMTPLS